MCWNFVQLYNYKQIRLKEPLLLFFVGPKRPTGNCYVISFITQKTGLPVHTVRAANFDPQNSFFTNQAKFFLLLLLYDNWLKSVKQHLIFVPLNSLLELTPYTA